MKRDGKKFRAAVEAAVEAEIVLRGLAPFSLETLTVNWDARSFTWRGNTYTQSEGYACISIPILTADTRR